MANLKIIGAARVKALIAMLNTQRDEEIKVVRASAMSHSDAQLATMKELGAEQDFAEIRALQVALDAVSVDLLAKTGLRYKANVSIDSYQSPAYLKYNEIMRLYQSDGIEAKVAKIKADYAAKENLLWLCETLEEAKAIVGVE